MGCALKLIREIRVIRGLLLVRSCSLDERACDVASLVVTSVGLEEVGEEEQFQNDEDDEELDENDSPQGTSQLHVPETIIVEVEDSV